MKSLFLERRRGPISSLVEPRGTDRKYLSAGTDRTFQFDAWAREHGTIDTAAARFEQVILSWMCVALPF